MCRQKARRANASIWDPLPSSVDDSTTTTPDAAGGCGGSCGSSRLAQLIRLAWQQDNPERLSQVLALVHKAGMPLSTFPAFRNEPDLAPLALPPAMAAAAGQPGVVGFGGTTRVGREKKHFVTRACEAVLGVTAEALEGALDVKAFFATFCHPDDMAANSAVISPAYAHAAALCKQALEGSVAQLESSSPPAKPADEDSPSPFSWVHQFQTSQFYPVRMRHVCHHGSAERPYQPFTMHISFAVGSDGSDASLWAFTPQFANKRVRDDTPAEGGEPARELAAGAAGGGLEDGRSDSLELGRVSGEAEHSSAFEADQDLEEQLAEILSTEPDSHFGLDELMQLDPTLLRV